MFDHRKGHFVQKKLMSICCVNSFSKVTRNIARPDLKSTNIELLFNFHVVTDSSRRMAMELRQRIPTNVPAEIQGVNATPRLNFKNSLKIKVIMLCENEYFILVNRG